MRSLRYRTASLHRLALFGVTLLLLSGIAVSAWLRDDVHAANGFASPAFQSQWQAGEAITQNFWGPLQNARDGQAEPYAEGVYNGQTGQRLVQYFDKGRMELNNPATGVVTSGLLATELITGRLQAGDNTFTQLQPAAVPVAGDPDNIGPTYASIGAAQLNAPAASALNAPTTRSLSATGTVGTYSGASAGDPQANIAVFDPDTQHNVVVAFAAFRNKVNLLNVGFAISEPFWSTVKVGGVQKDVLVQAFQRRVLTYTPSNPDAFKVEFGNIGQHYFNWRNSGAAVLPTATTAAATISAPTFTNLTATSVTVVYTTTFPACGTAEYRVLGTATWVSNIDSITCTSGSATTTQSVNLTGLTVGTTYEIRPAVKDVSQAVTYGPTGTVTTSTAAGTVTPTTAATATTAPATATTAPATATTAPATATTAPPTATTAPSGSPTPNPLPSRSP